MGEYIEVLNEHGYENVKLGTCENLYYMRYADLAELVIEGRARRASGSMEPEEYLKADSGFRFRFPFPGEDDDPLGLAKLSYDFGYGVTGIPVDLLRDMKHGRSQARVVCTTGAHWPKAMLDVACPQADESVPEKIDMEIVQQRLVDNELCTVIRCPYCHDKWRLDKNDGIAFAAWMIRKVNGLGEWAAIATRIAQGYNVSPMELALIATGLVSVAA